jgi:ring-1,2-phenylacetyl-CoA epoxidase subunit PaaC
MFTGDLFSQTEGDRFLIDMGIAADVTAFQEEWNQQVGGVLLEAGIKKPSATFMQQGSRKGIHTEHLGFLLAEMQSVQRNYPGNQW